MTATPRGFRARLARFAALFRYDPARPPRPLTDMGIPGCEVYVPPVPRPAAPAYEPHGIDTPETLARIRAQAEADAAAAQDAAQAQASPVASRPVAPLPEPPPMPPSELSRAMVTLIPSPPVNDRNFSWAHEYADYMRRIGVATGTTTELEHTMAWRVPALPAGDGTGEAL